MIFRMLLIISLANFLASCSSRILRGELWQNDGLPPSFCEANPSVKPYGMFRVVACKSKDQHPECAGGAPDYQEVIPYCSDRSRRMISADREKVSDWLNQATRPR